MVVHINNEIIHNNNNNIKILNNGIIIIRITIHNIIQCGINIHSKILILETSFFSKTILRSAGDNGGWNQNNPNNFNNHNNYNNPNNYYGPNFNQYNNPQQSHMYSSNSGIIFKQKSFLKY